MEATRGLPKIKKSPFSTITDEDKVAPKSNSQAFLTTLICFPEKYPSSKNSPACFTINANPLSAAKLRRAFMQAGSAPLLSNSSTLDQNKVTMRFWQWATETAAASGAADPRSPL